MSSSKSRAKARKKQNGASPGKPKVVAPEVVAPKVVAPEVVAPKVVAPEVVVSQTAPVVAPQAVPVVEAKPRAPQVQVAPPGAKEVSNSNREEVAPPSDRFWMGAMMVMVLAIVLRQVQLGQAPFHPDETIHTHFSYGFEGYHYDPVYHGPLLYHLVSLCFKVFGQYDYVARLVPSLLGIGLVALILGPARRWMGDRGSLAAGALVAVSPSIVTYSRHLLHDALVLDLTFGAVLCFISALHYPANEKRGRNALLGLAACLSLFLATKANFFFILVVIVAFWAMWQLRGLNKFPQRSSIVARGMQAVGVVVGAGIAYKVWPLLSSSSALLLPTGNGLSSLQDILNSPAPTSSKIVDLLGFDVALLVILFSVSAPFLIARSPQLRVWPFLLFANVTMAAIVFPRDQTFPEADKVAQHTLFQILAAGCCAAFLLWIVGRSQGEPEREARAKWKKGNDWATWVLALALALWIYVFLFGQVAQILAQWVTLKQFPMQTWIAGRDSAQHAIKVMLDYWGGQQAKPRLPGRHDYYIVLGILYELPILLAALGGIWHATKKRTVFSDFLLWWAFASWAVYAVANEKVPWLLVHIMLPLALLAALWIASLNWRKPLFFAATCFGLAFTLRGDIAMIFERAGDNAEPLLYAQTPDAFRDTLAQALQKTAGDGRDIWIGGYPDSGRQWPTLWYTRDTKWNPIRGTSAAPLGSKDGFNQADRTRVFIAQESDLVNWKDRKGWDVKTVNFLIWPRASWTGLQPKRVIPWFFSRKTIAPDEEQPGPGNSETSILSGKGEWSHATAIIGAREEAGNP